jgi:hypothetical protein
VKRNASLVLLVNTVIFQTRLCMDLIVACNASRTAPADLVLCLGMAIILSRSVLATMATLFTRAGHGTQQKTFDYHQSTFVSSAMQARISLTQCNGEKSVTL